MWWSNIWFGFLSLKVIGLSYVYTKDLYLVRTLNLISLQNADFTHEICWILPEIHWISYQKPFKSDNSTKTLHFHRVQGEAISYEIMKSSGFHVDFRWNPPIQQDFTKATEFYRISQFHKIQHNFTKIKRIYWNPEISKDFMNSNMILLKITEFYIISLNLLHISLQILLQILLWMLFMDFTADFITDFTVDFSVISRKSTAFHKILLKLTEFYYGFHFEFHVSGRSTDCNSWNLADFMKSTRFHEIYQIPCQKPIN